MTRLDYIRHWLVSVKKFHVKASTYDRLITSLEALQSYPIASKAVSDILPEDCEDYVKEVTSSGYALTTIKKQMRYQCLQICKEAGVPYHGLHVWRHTFATNQFYKGTDVKILSKILGHSETSVTYNIYIHLYGDGFNDMLKAVS